MILSQVQLSEVVDIFVDNIISPDDFTKIGISASYDVDSDSVDGSSLKEKVNKRLKDLKDKYKFDTIVTSCVQESCEIGDSFLLVAPIEERNV